MIDMIARKNLGPLLMCVVNGQEKNVEMDK